MSLGHQTDRNGFATAALFVILAGVALCSCGDSGSPNAGDDGDASATAAAESSGLGFVDETLSRGIDFEHRAGMSGKRWMPEQLGSGAAFFDCDGDGDLDLLCLNGGPLPGSKGGKPNALYFNDGAGRFTRVPDAGGLAGADDYGVGCAVADIDLDGDLDVFITNFGADRLYLNDGKGSFILSLDSGIESSLWGASAAFGDVNGDGLVDLYVTNYVQYRLQDHNPCYQGEVEVYCGPQPFKGERDTLYINQGGGRFEDQTKEAFGRIPSGKGLAVAMCDYDLDGDLDIYIANDQTPNNLFKNDGKGHFEDLADLAGVHVNKDGMAEAGMGIAFADYDNDQRADIIVTNFENQVNSIYHNEGDDFFMEVAWETGIGYESRPYLGWGIGLVDFDLDGWKDLYFGNGHVYDNAEDLNDTTHWGQKNRLHLNTRDGKFAAALSQDVLNLEAVTRGVAFADVDNDGDVDILDLNVEAAPRLLINQMSGRNWLMIDTAHSVAKTPLLGTRIEIRIADKIQVMTVQGGYSYLTHNDTRVHFGLDQATVVDSLEVTWPGGKKERFEKVPANRLLVLTPGGEAVVKDLQSGAEIQRIRAR